MAGRELVQASPHREGQVRSYHRAFSLEKTIYTIGDNIRLWWPIPVRGVFWAIGIEAIMLLLTQVTGVHSSLLSPDWGFLYVVIPVGLAWLFAGAKPEGRRLHVTLFSWLGRAIAGKQTVGGYRRLVHVDRMHGAKIKVRETYAPRKKLHWEKPAAIGLGSLMLLFLALRLLTGPSTSPTAAVTAADKTVPTPARHTMAQTRLARATRPAFPPARGVSTHTTTRRPHIAVHKNTAIPKSVVHSRKVAPQPPHHMTVVRAVATRRQTVVVHHAYVTPIHYSAPTRVIPRRISRPVSVRRSPCYPGELGC